MVEEAFGKERLSDSLKCDPWLESKITRSLPVLLSVISATPGPRLAIKDPLCRPSYPGDVSAFNQDPCRLYPVLGAIAECDRALITLRLRSDRERSARAAAISAAHLRSAGEQKAVGWCKTSRRRDGRAVGRTAPRRCFLPGDRTRCRT
jgi:hypothetical protein